MKATTRTAGIGGILRSADGRWKGGFVGSTAATDPTITEVCAIVKAMQWAWEKGVRDLEIQTDAKEAARWIREKEDLRGIARDLVNEAVSWCEKDWSISIRTIYREQNRSADALALMGNTQAVDWKEFSSCPPECEEAFNKDLMRATQCRRVRETS